MKSIQFLILTIFLVSCVYTEADVKPHQLTKYEIFSMRQKLKKIENNHRKDIQKMDSKWERMDDKLERKDEKMERINSRLDHLSQRLNFENKEERNQWQQNY